MISPSHPYEGSREEFREMVRMKLPIGLIASRFGMTRSQVYSRIPRGQTYAQRGPNAPPMRQARHERIVAHIAAYPNKSLFGGDE